MVKIKDIPNLERPRERLINNGVSSLSNEELIAIVLKTGFKNNSVKELANQILSKLDSIDDLKKLDYQSLIKLKGMGSAKTCALLASIELSKRLNAKYKNVNKISLKSTTQVFEYYRNKIDDDQECFYVIYIDNHLKVIKDKLLFKGTVNASLIHPREIFKEAYLVLAVSIICVHNHPSGDITPSKEDIITTNTLKESGVLLGIKLVDHIIIGKDNYYSFLEHGAL